MTQNYHPSGSANWISGDLVNSYAWVSGNIKHAELSEEIKETESHNVDMKPMEGDSGVMTIRKMNLGPNSKL